MCEVGHGPPRGRLRIRENRGCLASEAMRHVEHFKSHLGAWGIGLLYKVIEHLRPEKRAMAEPEAQYTKAKEAEKQSWRPRKRLIHAKQQKIERRQNELRAKKLRLNLARS